MINLSPFNPDGNPDDAADSTSFFEGWVSELMAETDAIALIQPNGYISVDTTPRNTGMSLGGISSAITATPAGTTPSLHFLPGYFIESTDMVSVRLTDFFFRERVFGYDRIKILDTTAFNQCMFATPLSGPDGVPYFIPGSTPDVFERALARIINCPTFYNDNKAKFARWNLALSDITQKYLSSPGVDHKRLNWSILQDIFPNCLTCEGDYFTSLTADIDSKSVDGFDAYPADAMYYRCLYPQSETIYGSQAHKCRILKRHFSPVAADNPKLCSLPVFRTEFVITNPTDETMDIALMQIQENIVGYEIVKSRPNEQDSVFYIQRSINSQVGEEKYLALADDMYFKGITLKQKPQAKRSDIDGEIHTGVYGNSGDDGIDISCCGSNITERGLIKLLYSLRAGRIGRRALPASFTGKEQSSGAVCVNTTLKPGETVTLNFVTILDFPRVNLTRYSAPKKYLEYFPDPGTRMRDILEYYLDCHKSDIPFERKFCRSMMSRLTGKLPQLGLRLKSIDQLTQLLLNSLSFLAEATVWDDKHFNVRECVDYPLFNSLDVYFYGSFGLMYLLPEADTDCIKAFTQCIFRESNDRRRYWMYCYLDDGDSPGDEKYCGPRLVRGAVPHDMGGAFDPKPNAYNWHNSNFWKDLAPKYILLVLRNYRYTDNLQVLKDCWPAIQCVLEFQNSRIEPGHCLPFVDGVSDTFDNISSHGISIYSASLWVAALKTAAEIARILQENGSREKFAQMADAAQRYLHDALWDESRGYYHYYSVPLSVADLDQAHISRSSEALERLKIKGAGKGSLDAVGFVMEANRYLYDNNAAIPEKYLEMYVREHADACNIEPGRPLNNKLKRIVKKYALYKAADGLLRKSFETKIFLESDDIFADQLLADLYLSLLELDPITQKADRKRALKNIFDINYKVNSPNIGAANLVTAEGRSAPEPQAQDIWVGIQYSIIANLLDCGMLDEFDELITVLHKNIYMAAKIPFGVPEAFNGNRIFSPHYIVKHMDICHDIAESIVHDLKEAGILSKESNTLEADFHGKSSGIPEILRKHGISVDRAKELAKLLKASSIKYTAGRYFRAGMVFAIIAVVEKLYSKHGSNGLVSRQRGKRDEKLMVSE